MRLLSKVHELAKRGYDRVGYLLAFLPVLTDWIDVGHLPHHPREFATESVIGVLILLGVHGLYRRADHFRLLSETDSLTGLHNRLRFRVDLDRAVVRARLSGESLSLAFVDVDAFKSVNDRFGHHAGDRLLQRVARALEGSTRKGVDGCYRLGGDEFGVLTPNIDSVMLLSVLRRCFPAAAELDSQAPLSCSVGVVTLTRDGCADELLRRADALMYAAKRGESVLAAADDGPAAYGKIVRD